MKIPVLSQWMLEGLDTSGPTTVYSITRVLVRTLAIRSYDYTSA